MSLKSDRGFKSHPLRQSVGKNSGRKIDNNTMDDKKKSKKQLIEELNILRNEIDSLKLSKDREADEALWMSARIAETVPDGITIVDCAGKIIFANAAAEKILGLTKIHLTKRIYNSPLWKITTVDGQPFPEDKLPLNMVIKKGDQLYTVEYAIQYPDGRRVILSVVSTPFHDSAGNLIGIISAITDITDRNKNEEALEFTKFSVDRSAIPTYWINSEARFVNVNDAACKMLGYSREELLKMTVHDIDPDYQKSIWGKHWADLKNQKKLIFESRHRKKDGSIVSMEINANYLEFRGREYNFAFALDISESKRAEASVRESEGKYRLLFNNMINSFAYHEIVLDKNGRPVDYVFLEVNDSFEKQTGLKRENIIGRKVTEVIPGINNSKFSWIDTYGKVALDGVEKTFEEYSEQLKKWYFVDVYSPKKGFFATIFQDITENKKITEALNESVEFYTTLANAIPDVVYIVDRTGKIKYINSLVATLFDTIPENIIGKSINEIFSPEYAKRHMNAIEQVFNTGEPSLGESYEKFPKRTLWVEVSLSPLKNKSGDVYAALGVSRDISSRREFERKLREREQAYRTIFETFYDVYFRMDVAGRITNVSPSVYAKSGYTPGEFIQHSVYEFFPEEDIKIFLEKIKNEKTVSDYETTLLTKDKKSVHIAVNAHSLFDENNNIVAIEGIIRDITEKKKSEGESSQVFESLKKSLEGIVRALAVTSETRDPYTAGHQRRVSKLSCAIAKEMGLTDNQIECIEIAGLLHDLGKISIPSSLLTKKGPLTKEDIELIRTHSKIGYEILKNIEFPWPIAPVVLQHHERLNGHGYPMQLTGEHIVLEAKIISVADVVEAISSKRPYRPALGVDKAIEEISKNKDVLFDAAIVDACIKVLKSGSFEFDEK